MEQLNFNSILNRENLANNIKEILINFEKNKKNLSIKRGIYIYGAPGSGKTKFVYDILKNLDYDIINYDAGDIRNKSIMDTITQHNMSDRNILSIFNKKHKSIAIIMDEIDGMNNGDKGGINSLIKIIRQKKTKKQKQEDVTYIPIICISNYHIDKKIRELMKVCHTFEINSPQNSEITKIIQLTMPELYNDNTLMDNILIYIQNDLRKLLSIYKLYHNKHNLLKNEIILDIFKPKAFNDDTKDITKKLINNKYSINDHNILMNETDRTIVGLLWHENIIEVLNKISKEKSIPLYIQLLDNICYSDYIDRITFQKQIWQFNEMSSLIKIFYNNNIYHNSIKKNIKFPLQNIRFTKVLTKYSTEYNNYLFIQNLSQTLGFDKKDIFSFFMKLKYFYTNEEIYILLHSYELTKLDINRIYRYIDKYTECSDDTCYSDDELFE
uniref:AAA+ ATPase domain-containing protein n=1 Tax=viral metagenome TaxID=1070528 RepID=A0A6C0AY44_9ZZZZ|tara:strand:+ start:62837 stop:64156 length:1320 start_codon:yes stop_codon:yes gene_type:complete